MGQKGEDKAFTIYVNIHKNMCEREKHTEKEKLQEQHDT